LDPDTIEGRKNKEEQGLRIPTKARYGMRAMVDVAMHDGADRPVLLKDIAARQNLSERYLEQIFSSLRHANLVRSVRGARGGFLLARPAAEINLLEVVEGCIGDLNMVECLGANDACKKTAKCATYIIWKELTSAMKDYLEGRTLAGLAEMQRDMDREDFIYYI
jgi:Rrf2 family cysteine metabolism transcriptional repressor